MATSSSRLKYFGISGRELFGVDGGVLNAESDPLVSVREWLPPSGRSRDPVRERVPRSRDPVRSGRVGEVERESAMLSTTTCRGDGLELIGSRGRLKEMVHHNTYCYDQSRQICE